MIYRAAEPQLVFKGQRSFHPKILRSMYEARLSSGPTTRLLLVILGILLLLQGLVTFLHLAFQRPLAALTMLVDFDMESNLPALFSVLLFLFAALLFFLHSRSANTQQARGCLIMAFVFIFLGLDEGARIHEKFGPVTHRWIEAQLGGGGLGGWLDRAWVIPYLLGGTILGLILVRWLFRLHRRTRIELLISGVVYVTGAVLLEMAGAKRAKMVSYLDPPEFPWLPCDVYIVPGDCYLYADLGYITLYTLEESLEMLGVILCIRALLRAMETKGIDLSVRMGRAAAPEGQ